MTWEELEEIKTVLGHCGIGRRDCPGCPMDADTLKECMTVNKDALRLIEELEDEIER